MMVTSTGDARALNRLNDNTSKRLNIQKLGLFDTKDSTEPRPRATTEISVQHISRKTEEGTRTFITFDEMIDEMTRELQTRFLRSDVVLRVLGVIEEQAKKGINTLKGNIKSW